jgi:hypothetical protein
MKRFYVLFNSFVISVILTAALTSTVSAQLSVPVFSSADIKAMVETTFASSPEMVAVAKCESGFRQFTASGAVLRGPGDNIGVFQINEKSHATNSKNLGFDIYTVEGNIGYAKYLYDKQGTRPWFGCLPAASAAAHIVSVPSAPVVPTNQPVTGPITLNLQFGMVNPQVLTLQQLLNSAGFTVAPTGAGSPGQETTRYGQLTREAVQRFQCSQGIACSGSESSTGYGRVGPKTRVALLTFVK